MENQQIELTKKELETIISSTKKFRTYKDKHSNIFMRNSIRKMNVLFFAKLLMYTMISIFIIFHLISAMRICKFISKSPSELPKIITKEQLCAKNNYNC